MGTRLIHDLSLLIKVNRYGEVVTTPYLPPLISCSYEMQSQIVFERISGRPSENVTDLRFRHSRLDLFKSTRVNTRLRQNKPKRRPCPNQDDRDARQAEKPWTFHGKPGPVFAICAL